MANILIQPVNIWVNGSVQPANNLEANSIYDNLETQSNFYYMLKKDDFTLITGNINIEGDAYTQWLINNFSTLWALEYICTQLNLIAIIPNN
jgi:hypothetical protein